MRYYIRTSGTTIHPQDPGYATKGEARKEMAAIVAAEIKYCRTRWRSAVKRRTGDCVTITQTSSPHSNLWTRIGITSF